MKNKKIMILIIAVMIIAIIATIIGVVINKKQDYTETKLKKIYNELSSGQTYTLTMEENNNKTIMAKKEDKTIIDQYTEDGHETTLIKDGNTYLILHDREEYYVYAGNNIEQNILEDGISELISKEFTKGNEKINGKKYSYEEYDGSTIFMLTNALSLDEQVIKTRFYFDKDNNLVYVKTIYDGNEELLKISLSNNVEDSLFEIPSNYAEND